jgi:thiamine biosynthesis lipoprotein
VIVRRSFAAMGTEVELLLDRDEHDEAATDALDAAQAEFGRLERIFSRFDPGSELSRLNRDGELADASPDLVRVLELALEARAETGGLFDPTVYDALAGAGYDRTFADVAPDGPAVFPERPCGGGIRIDGRSVELDGGTHVDLGGIAKGYAVDRACDVLSAAGPCLVNAGGDLAVRDGAWPVGVTEELTLELTSGALATSGRDRRRWRRGGVEQHHLIDPRTSAPATGGPLRVTVFAETAARAEVLAKAAFLGAEPDTPHVLVDADGRAVTRGGLA